MSADNFESRVNLFEAGIISPDELFDPVWSDEPTPKTTVMSEWDVAYQECIEGDTPVKTIPTREDNVRLVELIERGKRADLVLESMDRVGHYGLRRAEMTQASRRGQEAVQTMIVSNLRLAAWFVRHTMDLHRRNRLAKREPGHRGNIVRDLSTLSGGELDYSDRMQIASIGLIRAANSYTGYSKKGENLSFSNWALWSMESELLKVIGRVQSPVVVPVDVNDEVRKLKHARDELSDEGNNVPTYDDLADKLQKPFHKVVELSQTQCRIQPVSWEVLQSFVAEKLAQGVDRRYFDGEEGLTLDDLLVDGGSNMTVAEESAEYLLDRDMDDVLAEALSEREQLLLELRYGLSPQGEPMTLKEVGKIIGVSGGRTRQIESRALAKIRDHQRDSLNKQIAVEERFNVEDPQLGLRALVKIDEADDARLGIERPDSVRSVKSKPLSRYAGTRKEYTLEEFDAMRNQER